MWKVFVSTIDIALGWTAFAIAWAVWRSPIGCGLILVSALGFTGMLLFEMFRRNAAEAMTNPDDTPLIQVER